MRSKGAIKFFAVALVIVCLYQLSFTVVTSVVEGNAPTDPEQKEAYLDSMAQEPVYNLLVKEYTYNECKAREINLGLDLQGGMHVTLQVSMKELLLELSNNNDKQMLTLLLHSGRLTRLRNRTASLLLFFLPGPIRTRSTLSPLTRRLSVSSGRNPIKRWTAPIIFSGRGLTSSG